MRRSTHQAEAILRNTILSLCGAIVLAAALPASAALSVDAKLLDMLKSNGSITADQYAELTADLAKEQRQIARSTVSKTDVTELQQKIGWATNTVVSGDIRVRQDRVEIEGLNPAPNKDRQRFRARLATISQVTPTVEAGVRIATGNSNDVRSTNQDIDGYFTKKDLWLDRAYINWHPESVPGLKMFAGKMAQPWFNVADAMWDNDINPEGLAAQYSRKFGVTELFGSAGVFVLKNNVTGKGNEFHNDLRMNTAQFGVRMFPGDDYKLTLGGSVYHFYKDGFNAKTPGATPGSVAPAGLSVNGSTSTEFQLYEGFGQLDVLGLPLPLSVYGQYIHNAAANGPQGDDDTAWLLGFMTRVSEVAVNYNYRHVERNGVVGAFTDSDFAAGFTGSRGHTLRLNYNIANNFAFTTTYFRASSDASNPKLRGADTDVLMIDLVATF